MRRDAETYRLSEDHIHDGLEGKLEQGRYISYDNLPLYDLIRENKNEYPIFVTVSGGRSKHTGEYRFETSADAKKLIEKIVGGTFPEINNCDQCGKGTVTLECESHKGRFVFIIETKRPQL